MRATVATRVSRGAAGRRRRAATAAVLAVVAVAAGVYGLSRLGDASGGSPTGPGPGSGSGAPSELLVLQVVGTDQPLLALVGTRVGDRLPSFFTVPFDLSLTVPGQGDISAPEVASLDPEAVRVAVSNTFGAWAAHVAVLDLEGLAAVVDRGGDLRVHVPALSVTDAGSIETDCVVCAAGPWSREIGAMADVELAVQPEKRRIGFTGPLEIEGPVPMTIDFATGFYFHREGPGLLFGTNDVCDTQDEWLERAEPVLRQRAPILLDAPIAGGWWGDYEMTPDHNALIGDASGSPGRFLYATGFSGHGFQQAPAVGEIVTDLYLGREPFVDVTPLAADRRERRERNVV